MPRKIAIGPYDDIVVADKINNRVQVFMADGTFIQSYGGEDDNAGVICDGPVGVMASCTPGASAAACERAYWRAGVRIPCAWARSILAPTVPVLHVIGSLNGNLTCSDRRRSFATCRSPWGLRDTST